MASKTEQISDDVHGQQDEQIHNSTVQNTEGQLQEQAEKLNTKMRRTKTNGTEDGNQNQGQQESATNIGHSLLLSQAIRNNDEKQLYSLVEHIKEDFVIYKTVKGLPIEDIMPFIQFVDQQMRQQKLDNLTQWLIWVQKIFNVHRDYFTTVPDLHVQFGQFIEWMEKRVRNMDKLLQLQGRLRFFIEQIPMEAQTVVNNQKPMHTFDMDKGIVKEGTTSTQFAEEQDERNDEVDI